MRDIPFKFSRSVVISLLLSICFRSKASNDPQILKLSLSNDSLYYNTIVALTHDGTYGVDRLYDARLFSTNSSNVRLYSMIEEDRYAIQGVPYLDWRVDVSLGIYTPHTGDFTLSLEEKTDFPATYSIKLYDQLSQTFHDFNLDSTYVFFSDSVGFYDHRFSLIVQEPNVIEWNGSTWSNSVGPTSSDSVVIGGNYSLMNQGDFDMENLFISSIATMTVEEGITFDAPGDIVCFGSLVVESGGSLITHEGNFIDNNITIIRDTRFENGRFSMVGTPMTMAEELKSDALGVTVLSYHEKIDYHPNDGLLRWIKVDSSVLIPGKGYAQAFKKTLAFKGTPNDGSIVVDSISHTLGTNNPMNMRGWNLIANPYPCAIDPAMFIAANAHLDGQIALWDHHMNNNRGDNDDYLIINSFGSAGGPNGGQFNGYIGAMQGFFVRLSAPALDTIVSFTEDMRVSNNNHDSSFFKKANLNQIRISISSELGSRANTLVLFSDMASNAFDRLYDAKVFSDNREKLAIYSQLNTTKLAIQGVPETASTNVPIGINIPENGFYTIYIDSLGGYELYDQHTNSYLNSGIKNKIWLNKGSIERRFRLTKKVDIFREWTIIPRPDLSLLTVTTTSIDVQIRNLKLISMDGVEITLQEWTKTNQHWAISMTNIVPGAYILSMDVIKGEPIVKKFMWD